MKEGKEGYMKEGKEGYVMEGNVKKERKVV